MIFFRVWFVIMVTDKSSRLLKVCGVNCVLSKWPFFVFLLLFVSELMSCFLFEVLSVDSDSSASLFLLSSRVRYRVVPQCSVLSPVFSSLSPTVFLSLISDHLWGTSKFSPSNDSTLHSSTHFNNGPSSAALEDCLTPQGRSRGLILTPFLCVALGTVSSIVTSTKE